MTEQHHPLPEDAFPALYRSADQISLNGQRLFLRAARIRLILAVGAAIAAAFSTQAMAIVGAVAFATIAGIELYLFGERPEREWYDGRALAESAKTLAWRYAVAASPYAKTTGRTEDEVHAYFREQLEALLRDAPETGIVPPSETGVGRQLRQLRLLPLEERKEAYLIGRIRDQQEWYTSKARANRSRARFWRLVLIAAESLGLIAALLRAVGLFSVDIAGVFAAMVGAGAAWLAVKQHDSHSRAYAFAAAELTIAGSRLEAVRDETAWAAEAADAEEAISREHTMWRASRSTGPT